MTEHAEEPPSWETSISNGLLPPERRALLALLRHRHYRRGEVVFHQGDPGETLHLVRQGHLKVVIPGETGEETVLTIVGPGEFFGELALLDGGPRSATVDAATPMKLLVIGHREFWELLNEAPPLAGKIMRALSERLRSAEAAVTA